ncbi:MAG: 3-deoxy-D-manno-octulosonic acid transferase [Methylococcaceae bacterium]|nr:3-deoxy-D-manno-octulosonic acid transferase [Methylococcaceae bacterium]
MRLFYTLLFYLLTPFVLCRLFWRGFKAPEYRKRWLERLAIYNKKYPADVIWIHAVSVGEAEAVFPLVKQLQQKYPSDNFLVTTTTPTGSARVKKVLADTVSHVYLPYDLPVVVNKFIAVFKPKIAIIMEKEIWPNLYASCASNKIPLMIINARLSANSAKGYKKIPGLVKPALDVVSWIATQTVEDRQRFIEIGARENSTTVTGNLKFDLFIAEKTIQQAKEIKQQLFSGRFVWIVASTHDKEEEIFFDVYPQLKKLIPELLLVIVPRHPERFERVKQMAEAMQLNARMRSAEKPSTEDTDVYIVDTMGELKLFYGAADICFVGGSMVPVGGHNILEPAAIGVPIMFGPYMINFKDISKNVLDLKAAIQCIDNTALIDTVIHLYTDADYREAIATRAKQFVVANQGATDGTVKLIADQIL